MFGPNKSAVPGLLFLLIFLFLQPGAAAQNNAIPLLDSISPTAVAPGSSAFVLTLIGGNFVPGSIVNWNGNPLPTTYVSVIKLTAAISASQIASESTITITVSNPAPGGGTSNPQFLALVAPASSLSFTSTPISGPLPITTNVVQADFNNDGNLDLAFALNNLVYVLLGNGDGTFQPAVSSPGPPNSILQGLFVADVNHDGKPDLFATGHNTSANSIVTLFGNGDGTFKAPVETDFWGGSISLADFVFADFNQDGALDAAFAADLDQLVVLYGNVDGSFTPGPVSTLSQYDASRVLAAADFTGQGSLSLVVQLNDPTFMEDNFIGVFTGSNGSFNSTASAFLAVGGSYSTGENVLVADFNGDGFLDIATVVSGTALGSQSYLAVTLNTANASAPSFAPPYIVPGSTAISQLGLHPLVAGDFNADGNLDLASDGLIFFGDGQGNFPTSTGNVSEDFYVAGDFNNDGRTDLVRVDPSSTQYPVLGMLLQTPPTADFLGSLSPSSVTVGLNSSVSVSFNVHPLSGFSSDVALSVSGLPAGIASTFSPASVSGGSGSSTLALTLNGTVPLGSYTVTITATGGGVTHSYNFALVVNSSPGSFTSTVTPETVNVTPGSSAVFTITVAPADGFTGDVVLTLSGSLPPGATYTLSQPTIAAGNGTSTLTVNIPATLPPSVSYVSYVTIGATSGTITKSSTVAIGIQATSTTPVQHTVHLSWVASTSQVVGYWVYRSSVSGTDYSPLNVTLVPSTTYDDSTVLSGSTYYYVVTAANAAGTQSSYSNQATAVIPTP